MPGRIKPPLPTRTRNQSRELRQADNKAEQALWFHLRAGRLNGYKFRRQHPIPPYVVDFYCDAERLVVELDGSQHNDSVDLIRTRYLELRGMKVVRFWDNEALQKTEAVLETILATLENRTLTPTPLPQGEGLNRKE